MIRVDVAGTFVRLPSCWTTFTITVAKSHRRFTGRKHADGSVWIVEQGTQGDWRCVSPAVMPGDPKLAKVS